MTGPVYPVWSGTEWIDLPVASMGDERLVVPNIAGLVYHADRDAEVLLQRRDKTGESVRGRWELPGGRWRAGEPPEEALRRELREETGLEIESFLAPVERVDLAPHVAFGVVHPVAVVNGIDGAYPSLHILISCTASGAPRPLEGETADPTWWRTSDLLTALDEQPESFVWHTRAMLRAAFDGPSV